MQRERGMLFIAGEVTIVSDAASVSQLGPLMWTHGINTRVVRYDECDEVRGLLVVDARAGLKKALAFLRAVPGVHSRDAIVIANPLEPFVYGSIRSVCQGVVLYDPIDPIELAQVIDTVLSRRKAS